MKKIILPLSIGLILGLLAVVIQKASSIPKDTFMLWFYIAIISIVVCCALINVLYYLSYRNKIKKAIILLTTNRPKECLEALEHLKSKAKGAPLKRWIDINLSAAHCALNQYDTAIALLEPLCNQKLKNRELIVQRLNLCHCYFYTAQNEKAMALYLPMKNQFDGFKGNKAYNQNILLLELYVALEQKQLPLAENLLQTLETQSAEFPLIQEKLRQIRANLNQ